jgi:hypothetical protein
MEKRHKLGNRTIVVKDFFGANEHLYLDQLGWTAREKQEARSFVSKEIFEFEVVKVGLNLAFYYVDNDTFYGIHTERTPIEVKVLPRDIDSSPYINSQCKGDTHVEGEVIFSCEDRVLLWDGIRIDGKTLEEVLYRSYIITLN